MLVRTLVVAVPLLLGAAKESQSGAPATKPEKEQPSNRMGDSVEGHGHSAGALGNSSDTTGAEGKGGAGSRSGTEGAGSPVAGGETSSPSNTQAGRTEPPGEKTGDGAEASTKRGPTDPPTAHAGDRTISGKLSELSGDSATIETGPGKSHTLKIVPQTKFTSGGLEARRGEIEEGQQVRASYMEKDGDDIAVRIEASGGRSDDEKPTGAGLHNERKNHRGSKE